MSGFELIGSVSLFFYLVRSGGPEFLSFGPEAGLCNGFKFLLIPQFTCAKMTKSPLPLGFSTAQVALVSWLSGFKLWFNAFKRG